MQSIQQDSVKNLAVWFQKSDSTVVITNPFFFFAFIQTHKSIVNPII